MTPVCACGRDLVTPRQRRLDKCADCEELDRRMRCVNCDKYVGMAYCDGRPMFCSDACEARWYEVVV